MKTYKKGLANDITITFLTRVFVIISGLIVTIITTKYLTLDERGMYTLAVTLSSFACQFGNLGLHGANTYYSAKSKKLIPGLIGNSIASSLIIGGLIGLLIIEIAPVTGYGKYGTEILYITASSIPLLLVLMLFQNLTLGIQDIKTYNISELVFRYTSLSLILLIMWREKQSGALIFGASIISAVVSMFIIANTLLHKRPKWHISGKLFQKCLKYGFRSYISSLLSFAVLKIGLLFVSYKFSPSDLAIYSLSMVIIDLVSTIPHVVASIFFPRVVTISEKSEKLKFMWLIALSVGVGTLFICLCVAWIIDYIIPLMFTEEYLQSGLIFLYLLPGVVIIGVNSIFMNYFAAVGLPPVVIYSPALALIIQLLFLTIILPDGGLREVAISFTISTFIMIFLSLLKLLKSK